MKYYFYCPSCGNDESFIRPKRIPFFGDLWAYIVLSDYQNHQVQCTRCLVEFRQPSLPKTPLSKFATWVALATATLIVGGLGLGCVSGFSEALPSYPGIQVIEDAIAASPRLTAYVLAGLLALLALPSFVIGFTSHYRLKKRLAKTHRLEPDQAPIVFSPGVRPPSVGVETL